MNRTIMVIVGEQVVSDTYNNIKPALKAQFETLKNQLTKDDWQEINLMAMFLTTSIFVDASRIAGMPDDDTSRLIQQFINSETDHIDDTILFNQRCHEYSKYFNPNNPTPFAALSDCFLSHLSVNVENGMLNMMMWINSLYMSSLSDIVQKLTPNNKKQNTIKTGGSGCLTLIVSFLILCVLFLFL